MDNDLHELFLDELKDMYDAEQQITKALPKMAKAADASELRTAFETHLSETENQIQRLEQVFESLGEAPKGKKCKGMQGLLKEGEDMMKELKDTNALDASLVASAQKVEHYEIASYGSLCAWARQMGHDEAADLLQENLDEEKATDGKLTEIAESVANQEAEQSTSG
jgi:ferritin-like metal-binding protein YciE